MWDTGPGGAENAGNFAEVYDVGVCTYVLSRSRFFLWAFLFHAPLRSGLAACALFTRQHMMLLFNLDEVTFFRTLRRLWRLWTFHHDAKTCPLRPWLLRRQDDQDDASVMEIGENLSSGIDDSSETGFADDLNLRGEMNILASCIRPRKA